MNAIPWKRLVPVFAALALFYALSLVYFSPMLEGKSLDQHDIRQWQGMAKEVDEHRAATGEEALWTGSMFSGMPAYQISVVWTSNLLRYADKLFHGFLPRPANFLFLYLMGMFVLLRILKVDPWLSLVGAIAFAFSSYFFVILPAGHTSKANAIGYMPMVLGGVYLLYRGRFAQSLGAAACAARDACRAAAVGAGGVRDLRGGVCGQCGDHSHAWRCADSCGCVVAWRRFSDWLSVCADLRLSDTECPDYFD